MISSGPYSKRLSRFALAICPGVRSLIKVTDTLPRRVRFTIFPDGRPIAISPPSPILRVRRRGFGILRLFPCSCVEPIVEMPDRVGPMTTFSFCRSTLYRRAFLILPRRVCGGVPGRDGFDFVRRILRRAVSRIAPPAWPNDRIDLSRTYFSIFRRLNVDLARIWTMIQLVRDNAPAAIHQLVGHILPIARRSRITTVQQHQPRLHTVGNEIR